MKRNTWKPYLYWILFTEAVGGLSGWLTREGTKIYNATVTQPPLSPPSFVFPIVWAILFALMGIGVTRVSLAPSSGGRSRSLLIYLVQLGFNFLWSILFFNYQAFGLALIWLLLLWLLIIWMILSFWKVDRPAALLQIPYLLWVSFAAYLNYSVWMLNR